MKGHIASSIPQLKIGGLYFSLNWVIFCYPNLATIKFATETTNMNLYSVGETNDQNAETFAKRASSFFKTYFNDSLTILLIPKKDSFLILERIDNFYKILYGGKVGYIQALSLFKLRESVERI